MIPFRAVALGSEWQPGGPFRQLADQFFEETEITEALRNFANQLVVDVADDGIAMLFGLHHTVDQQIARGGLRRRLHKIATIGRPAAELPRLAVRGQDGDLRRRRAFDLEIAAALSGLGSLAQHDFTLRPRAIG